jgi:hypothetical protein
LKDFTGNPYSDILAEIQKCRSGQSTPVNVNPHLLSVSASGDTRTVTVSTDGALYQITRLPPWCSIQNQSSTSFQVVVQANTGAARNGSLTIRSSGGEALVNINQAAREVTPPSTSPGSLSFTASGSVQTITVSTDGASYQVTTLPPWCSIRNQSSTSFQIVAQANTGAARNGSLTIRSSGGETHIKIIQEGKPPKPTATLIHSMGLTAGILDMRGVFSYDDFMSRTGFRAGLQYRISSQNKSQSFNSFGLKTGIFYEYQAKIFYYGSHDSYNRHVITLPLHPELSLNVLNNLSIYLYIGPSFDYVIVPKLYGQSININLSGGQRIEYYIGGGGGIRISNVQFNLGYDEHLAQNRSFNPSQQKNSTISFSLSYLFYK